ncbi:MAG TPA: anthranilate synthase component I family protein [Candidatus Agrococcus pullicola]|uniref:Anthranilate synthase component I family protein n=1 Tax=Candidatus Agrococcus pullicola TaxID=2838429 RepID=A0A9D1YYG4_9MICO|nr:anthranilate synthase component I family protein [Candidatus Agrococcus pullicola]
MHVRPPLSPELNAGWSGDVELDPLTAFHHLEAAYEDVVWLEDAVEDHHVIAVGGQRQTASSFDELLFDERPSFGWIDYELGLRELGLTAEGGESRWLQPERWCVFQDGRAQLQSTGEAWEIPPRGQSASRFASETPGPAVTLDDDDAYAARIGDCLDWIADGDSYLACLTTAYTVEGVDPVATYLALRSLSPSHRGGFMRLGGKSIASISPERFLELRDGRVRTRPIKGTRPRGASSEQDAAFAASLVSSDKERAENVMIVDLCRNDLHLVCEPGTVSVPALLQVETYSAVHQLVSTVEGRIRSGLSAVDVIRALFPAGSMVGTPKRRTAELLQTLEGRPRGTYSGCFGVVSANFADLSMTIRALVEEGGVATIGVGGGITALSDVEEEVAEVRLKADALLRSLRGFSRDGSLGLDEPDQFV